MGNDIPEINRYSHSEEKANAISHIIGAIGAVFYSLKKIKYMHSVFHLFVILGDVFHMIAVWNVIN